jgi:hypothetical protein
MNLPVPALWTDGVPRVLPISGGGMGPYPRDVNTSGVVVGGGYGSDGNGAWEYRDGKVRQLPTLPGFDGWGANGVNESGDIAGYAWSRGEDKSFAVLWPADEPGSVRILDAPQSAQAVDIADDGTVLGNLVDPPKVIEPPAVDPSPSSPVVVGGGRRLTIVHKAYLWNPDGRGRELPVAGGSPAQASMIRGNLVFGSNKGDPFDVHPVRWNLRTGTATLFGEVMGSRLGAGNRAGWAAVMSRDGLTRISPGGSIDRLVKPPSVSSVVFMTPWISADGRRLVANTVAANSGGVRPMTWHC